MRSGRLCGAKATLCLKRGSLLQVANNLMPVGSTIPSTAHVYPEVFSVCGFQNQLIEVSVTFQPIEPAIMVHGHIRFMVQG